MNTFIRRAEEQDIPVLCKIWKDCFHDSEDYIRLFYKENFERIDVIVNTVDGKAVSMVNIIDCLFVSGKEEYKAKYIYAAGTDPCFRNKGCFTELIEYVICSAKQNGTVLFLKPSNAGLIPFYEKSGFKIDSYFRLLTVYPGEKQPLSLTPLSPEEYNRMRNEAFSSRSYVKWDNRHLRWCIKENEYFSGKTLSVNLNGKDYFIMAYPDSGTLVLNETNLSPEQLKQLCGALCDMFKTKLIKAYLPDFSCNEGEKIVSSAVYNSPLNNTYVNLILI